MTRTVLASLLSIAAAVAPLAAQDRFLSAVQYSVALPVGDTHRYIPRASWSGAIWEWRWSTRPHSSMGVLTGYNEFHRRESGTFDFPAGAATGEQYRHLLMVPVLVTGAWYFTADRDDPRWYVGGGGGLQFTQQIFQLGLQQRDRLSLNLLLVPEVGLAFPVWFETGAIVSLRYHLPSNSGGLLGDDARRFQYASLSLGFGVRY